MATQVNNTEKLVKKRIWHDKICDYCMESINSKNYTRHLRSCKELSLKSVAKNKESKREEDKTTNLETEPPKNQMRLAVNNPLRLVECKDIGIPHAANKSIEEIKGNKLDSFTGLTIKEAGVSQIFENSSQERNTIPDFGENSSAKTNSVADSIKQSIHAKLESQFEKFNEMIFSMFEKTFIRIAKTAHSMQTISSIPQLGIPNMQNENQPKLNPENHRGPEEQGPGVEENNVSKRKIPVLNWAKESRKILNYFDSIGLATSTVAQYTSCLRNIREYGLSLCDLTKQKKLMDLQIKLRKFGKSTQTIKTYFQAIKHINYYLYPDLKIKFPKVHVKHSKRNAISHEEIKCGVIKMIKNGKITYAIILMILYSTGLRWNEAAKLEFFGNKSIMEKRTIEFLPTSKRGEIRECAAITSETKVLIEQNQFRKFPIKNSCMNKIIKLNFTNPSICVHSFRHSHFTRRQEVEIIKVISKRMGHLNEQTTKKYMHITKELEMEVVDELFTLGVIGKVDNSIDGMGK